MASREDLIKQLDASDDVDTTSNKFITLKSLSITALIVVSIIFSISKLAVEGDKSEEYPITPQGAVEGESIIDAQVSSPVTETVVLQASGYIMAKKMMTVSSNVSGRLNSIMIEEGMRVKQGELLATFDDSIPQTELKMLESQYSYGLARLKESEAEYTGHQVSLRRIQRLFDSGNGSVAELDEMKTKANILEARVAVASRELEIAKENINTQLRRLLEYKVYSPMQGVVVDVMAQAGEVISSLTTFGTDEQSGICTIVDMNSLHVEVEVSEQYISRVAVGQRALAKLNAYPDLPVDIEVALIVPTANKDKSTVKVWLNIIKNDPRILPEMGVEVSFFPPDEEEEQGHLTSKLSDVAA
ncbi:efflux RND transporter periplasmic adaptor subunit [Shewanella woodyi]|uniref:Secretion protein HlyD family protein n=1 Tax=Shewanella woodyi (strain ATCC 51908 / MS32) TaxID=392500 RepID=B1KR97_SHEWM|nr:efflux RND transporter periplasmic adaptor subunit [Shewanella woodyi]ACA86304.1 secretion protein HlyD family protein [Shewanella woodyi ATCC 51908]